MEVHYEREAGILKALAHPTRLEIIAGLLEDECNVTKIQRDLGLPQSTISQHLRVLKSVGIVKGRREGTRICYSVVDEQVREIMRIIEEE